MPNQPAPGYNAAYQKARRAAHRRLKEAHEDEWQGYFNEERNRQEEDK